jgi:uncharacterized membrane protein YukC
VDRIIEGIEVQVTQSPQWHRQNLVTLERIHYDIARFTGPVFHIVTIAASIYLPCYAKLMLFSAPGALDPMMVLLALSAAALVLVSPAFALAATVEVYLTRRVARASRAGASHFHGATSG